MKPSTGRNGKIFQLRQGEQSIAKTSKIPELGQYFRGVAKNWVKLGL